MGVWEADAVPAVSWASDDGYCGQTEQRGDCVNGERGTLSIRWKGGTSLNTSWSDAGNACARACRGCSRCRFISVSRVHGDCSWYYSCNLVRLHSKVSGFRSAAVAPLESRSPVSLSTPTFRWGWGVASHVLPSAALEERGYCESAPEGGSCARADLGSWVMASSIECARRCLGCERCNYISYSHRTGDCSWFHECDVSRLRVSGDGHVTQQLKNTTPFRLSDLTSRALQHALGAEARPRLSCTARRVLVVPGVTGFAAHLIRTLIVAAYCEGRGCVPLPRWQGSCMFPRTGVGFESLFQPICDQATTSVKTTRHSLVTQVRAGYGLGRVVKRGGHSSFARRSMPSHARYSLGWVWSAARVRQRTQHCPHAPYLLTQPPHPL